MKAEKKSFLEKLNSKWVTPLFAIITVIYGTFYSISSAKMDEYSKKLDAYSTELDNISKKIENELRVKEFDNNLKMTIYSEVKEAIQKKDTTLQNATLIVINEMLQDDSLFREKLKTVLFASSNSQKLIEVQQKIDQFSTEQKTVQKNNISSDDFKIDVFYLDEIVDEAKPRAEKVVELIRSSYPEMGVRLRLLPKEVNARSGYRISSNQIRYNADERNIAEGVLELIDTENIFPLETPVLKQIDYYDSPNYISIFVRNM